MYLLFGGVFYEPLRQLAIFITRGEVVIQNLSWQTKDILVGFLFINLAYSFLIIFTLIYFLKRKPSKRAKSDEDLLRSDWFSFIGQLSIVVLIEEAIFRAFPLMILLPLGDTKWFLWSIVLGSSVLWAFLWHFYAGYKETGYKNPSPYVKHVISGVIYSYIFLSFGFFSVFLIHLIFDVIWITPSKIIYNINPQPFKQ